ncbi:hypothetical protein DFH07DRAFT_842198 [Mycena maculata]|uniref:Uncharacterized protein n=1 Tax=Mycena maculata TaxID=230809 RepID=A0AAD7I8J4_9AGAR|nr:hypothetical protein DFH07DRAFT_842198 [Mycena maculata]
MWRHQAAQLQRVLAQAYGDAGTVEYHWPQQTSHAHSSYPQREEGGQEQLTEQEYHMHQAHRARVVPQYLDMYATYAPHPHDPLHAPGMGMGTPVTMKSDHPHLMPMELHPLDLDTYRVHQPPQYLETLSPAAPYSVDSPEYHTHPYPHPHHYPHPHSTHDLPLSPISPHSIADPLTPLDYHFAATMPSSAFGTGFEDTLKYETSWGVGPLDMNMNMMGTSMGIGWEAG